MLGPSSLYRENGGAIQALSGPPLKSPDGTRVPSEKKTGGTREEDDSTAAIVPATIIFYVLRKFVDYRAFWKRT